MNQTEMKIHIVFDITDNPRGGGNQFLKALRNGLSQRGSYADRAEDAEIFLFNSYQFIDEVCALKKRFADRTFIHRIDGPIRLYNSLSDRRDQVTNDANRFLADATIFQSEWSRRENFRMGLAPSPFQTTIHNAVDPDIFNAIEKTGCPSAGKIRLIAASWSDNPKKGFDTYRWLDDHLDFTRYAMTFVGNSPVSYRNIRRLAPLDSRQLAEEFKGHDIFITASQKDPCSNALLEALSCGLPALALRDGGHPELIKDAGLLFDAADEIPVLLERMTLDYAKFRNAISVKSLGDVVDQYYSFMSSVRELMITGQYTNRKFPLLSRIRMMATLFRWRGTFCSKVM